MRGQMRIPGDHNPIIPESYTVIHDLCDDIMASVIDITGHAVMSDGRPVYACIYRAIAMSSEPC